MDVQSVEVAVPEEAIPDLSNIASLTEYKEVQPLYVHVIRYITGFIVKKVKEKIKPSIAYSLMVPLILLFFNISGYQKTSAKPERKASMRKWYYR